MTDGVQILLIGLTFGGVYALMASGLTLIFGVMRIVNIAHAAFIMVAAYLAYWLFKLLGIDPIASILITMPAMFLLGIAVYRLIFRRLEGTRRVGEATVLLTFALALVIEGLLGFAFTNIYRSTTPAYSTEAFLFGPYYLPESQFYATVLSFGLIALLWAFLRFTRTGYAIRATMQNRDTAQIVGVNVERISLIVFGIGMALAGASGSMLSFLFAFYPGMHWEWISVLLSLVVLGGMGSLPGALIGSLLLAVTSTYVSSYFGPTWTPITFFLALFVILLVRPQGMMGRRMEA